MFRALTCGDGCTLTTCRWTSTRRMMTPMSRKRAQRAYSNEVDLYLRISQDKLGLELAVDRQEEACRELCERMGWVVRHVYREAASATKKKKRPEFERLLEGRPPRVVMWSVDRLVRKGPDLERLIDLDVDVHSVQAGPMDLATASGRLNARLLTSVATFEGEIKAERQQLAAQQRADLGKPWWPTRPFGFNMDGTHHAEEADALRAAYKSVLAGGSLAAVERDWAKRGFITVRAGKPWKATSIRPVLLNARNAGIRVYDGEEVGLASWKPIVSEETYRAMVRTLNSPDRKHGGGSGGKGRRENLLTGFAVCGVCGQTVRAANRRTKQGTKYRIYQCSAGQCVTQRADWLDNLVTHVLMERLMYANTYEEVIDQVEDDVEVSVVHEELEKISRRLDSIMDEYADGEITREERNRMTERLKARQVELRKDLASVGLNQALVDLLDVADLRSEWNDFDMNRKHSIVTALFDYIVLQPRGKGANEPKLEDVEISFYGAEQPLALR